MFCNKPHTHRGKHPGNWISLAAKRADSLNRGGKVSLFAHRVMATNDSRSEALSAWASTVNAHERCQVGRSEHLRPIVLAFGPTSVAAGQPALSARISAPSARSMISARLKDSPIKPVPEFSPTLTSNLTNTRFPRPLVRPPRGGIGTAARHESPFGLRRVENKTMCDIVQIFAASAKPTFNSSNEQSTRWIPKAL
jgi:hypothetical protein